MVNCKALFKFIKSQWQVLRLLSINRNPAVREDSWYQKIARRDIRRWRRPAAFRWTWASWAQATCSFQLSPWVRLRYCWTHCVHFSLFHWHLLRPSQETDEHRTRAWCTPRHRPRDVDVLAHSLLTLYVCVWPCGPSDWRRTIHPTFRPCGGSAAGVRLCGGSASIRAFTYPKAWVLLIALGVASPRAVPVLFVLDLSPLTLLYKHSFSKLTLGLFLLCVLSLYEIG